VGAADYPIITDETLPSIIEGEVAKSIGHWDGSLSAARTREFDYYYGKPFGNEIDGESNVVSTDVADTIEGILPIILNIFTSSDDVVRFDPNGPEDEEQASQQTEVANYVFYRQNNGFLILYEWFKDALIQKNGIVKYWWDEKTTKAKETYKGLTEGEYRMLVQGNENYVELKVLEKNHYDDPAGIAARQIMTQKILTQAPPEAQAQLMQAMQAQPLPQLWDCTIEIVKDASQIRIQAIPPEEFGISAQHNCVSIQDTPFCYHRSRKSISSLREMGCPEEILSQLAPANITPDYSPESLARDRYLTDTWNGTDGPNIIERDVWVTECFIRCDYDNDGISELRHIIMPGRTVWINEETDHINFAALTPIIMPHRWIGRSVSELVMDIQFTKSVIWRQMLNNLYLTNNPQKAVLSSAGGIVMANLDDLLSSRPGGILREYQPGAIRNIETPFVAAASFPMLEYMDGVKENRSGVTRYNQGTDADSLNKTARGIQMIQTAGAQRTNLIARIFAETGVKDLMRGITYMLSKYGSKTMTLKLRNKWVDIDPREWKTQFNMTVNVGLGTGNRDVQLAHLNAIHQQQIELMKTGRGYMVSDENIWNLYKKMQESMGFKHPELFIADPEKIPPEAKKQPPDPAIVKAQMDAQEGQAKLQFNAQKEQLSAQTLQAVEQIKAQAAIQIAQMDNVARKEIEQMKISGHAQIAVFEKQNSLKEESLMLDAKAAKVDLAAQTLDVKSNLAGAMDETRKQIADQNVAAIEQREQAIVQTMNNTMLAAMQQIGQQIGSLAPLLQQVVAASQAAVIELKKPKVVSVDNVETDENGKIVSAKVSSTSVMVQ